MAEHFPDTSITFDKFHVVKLLPLALLVLSLILLGFGKFMQLENL